MAISTNAKHSLAKRAITKACAALRKGVQLAVIRAARDQLAGELRALSGGRAETADIFARIADLDHHLSTLHQARPSGAKGFVGNEACPSAIQQTEIRRELRAAAL